MNDSLEPPRLGRRRAAGRSLLRQSRTLAVVEGLVLLAIVVVVLLVVFPPLGDDDPAPTDERPSSDAGGAPVVTGEDPVEVGDLTGVSRPAAVAIQTWARPDLSYDEWWDALSPLLTPGARTDYAQTDPANLPRLELDLEEDVEERPGPSRDTATVFFSTSAGRFGVDMSRPGADGAWLMVRIVFPGQESGLS